MVSSGRLSVLAFAKSVAKEPHWVTMHGTHVLIDGNGVAHAPWATAKGKRRDSSAKPDRSSLPEHIRSLGIPPAWRDVRYNADPEGDVLVTAVDAKGRRQYIYSERFLASQAAAKYERVMRLERDLDGIRRQNDANRRSGKASVRDSADCLALIMATGIRPGSDADTKADQKAYGATTLLGSHVRRGKDGVRLVFTGKKGVELDIPVEDRGIAEMLVRRARRAGPDGKVFPEATQDRVLALTRSYDHHAYRTKDLRTLVAATTADAAIRSLPPPKTEVAYRKAVRAVAATVATKLGNTPAVALQSYIPPQVFAEWRMSAHVTA